MELTLKRNPTDQTMIEMWKDIDHGGALLVAIFHEDCLNTAEMNTIDDGWYRAELVIKGER